MSDSPTTHALRCDISVDALSYGVCHSVVFFAGGIESVFNGEFTLLPSSSWSPGSEELVSPGERPDHVLHVDRRWHRGPGAEVLKALWDRWRAGAAPEVIRQELGELMARAAEEHLQYSQRC